MNQSFIYLASASPRRRELLEQIGVPFRVCPADIPERAEPGEGFSEFAKRMALAKACKVRDLTSAHPKPVLGADTVVVADEEMMGKPADRAAGLQMLEKLSGRSHEVLSAVAMVDGARQSVVLDSTRVWFREITPEEREAYWRTGEQADKAGAYAVQGVGAVFIRRIEGSFSGVMGLPLYQTARLLADFGHPVPAFAGGQAHA